MLRKQFSGHRALHRKLMQSSASRRQHHPGERLQTTDASLVRAKGRKPRTFHREFGALYGVGRSSS
eukprot:14171801-Heterocapsa_arctica.AAC.1